MKASMKRKLGYVTTTMLSLSAVLSASVSTYAWFQAQANVTIHTTSSSTTITVNKPDDYTFYGYNGNIGSHSPTGTFSNDFTALTSSLLVNQYTNLTGMSPGDIYVFAIGINAASSVSLTLDQIISNNATKQNIRDTASVIQERYVQGQSDWKLNIGYAIDIFVSTYTPTNGNAPAGYTSFLSSTTGTDIFNYTIGTSSHRDLLDSGSNAEPEISTSISFFNNASLTSTNDLYIMWSVVFSDANTLKYNEVNSTGIAQKERVVTGPRYFQQSNTGTSNCYGGLTFALKAFTLTIG